MLEGKATPKKQNKCPLNAGDPFEVVKERCLSGIDLIFE